MNLARHLGVFSWAVAARLLPLIYGAVLILVVYAVIPVSENGRYWVVFATFTWITLLNKSLILFPMLKFASSPSDYNDIIRASFWLNAGFYIIFAIISFIFSPQLASLFNIQTDDFLIVAWLLGAIFLRDFIFCIHQIRFKTGRIFLIEAVYYLGSSAGIVLLTSANKLATAYDVWMINFWAAVASSLFAIVTGFGGVNLFGKIKFSVISKIIKYGRDTLGVGISNGLLYAADTWMIGWFFTLSDVGLYNGAKSVWRVLSSVNQAVGMLVLPYIAKVDAQRNYEERKAIFEKIVGYTFIALAFGALVLGFIAKPFYAYFMDGKYAGAAGLLWIMLIGTPFEGIYNASGQVMYAIGKARAVATVASGSLVVFIITMWIGGNYFASTGIAGALSLALICSGIWMYVWTAKHLDTNLTNVINRMYAGMKGIRSGK